MNTHVDFEVSLLRETLSTLRAYERLFSIENSHVGFKVSLFSETFYTLLAAETSHSGVNTHGL